MVDIEHKVLKSIKDNIGALANFLSDESAINSIMMRREEIDVWDRTQKIAMYQSITEDVLNNWDINKIVEVLVGFRLLKSSSIDVEFQAVAAEYLDFLKKVYEVYLLDQILYILNSCSREEIMDTESFRKPFKTGSNYESLNFEVIFWQVSLDVINPEDIYKRIYNIKEFYLEQIRALFKDKAYVYKKALLNDTLGKIEDSYYVFQLFIVLNTFLDPLKTSKKKEERAKVVDEMQLTLKL